MYIRKLFAQKRCVFSAEFFPPKQVLNWESLQKTLREVQTVHPDFVSVTCSAGGSGVGGVSTRQVASYLKNQLG
ncbi:MAG: methylenetetrahydrofolate reductase, partial [Oscillospiraceae bacterium]|nr:methylenetetrahydrofolate reductase [Oscillospiraceae bacterium]